MFEQSSAGVEVAFSVLIRKRLKAAADAAGVDVVVPEGDLLPSVVIRLARRCGVPVSHILYDPLRLACDI